MRQKFIANIWIVLPAAIGALLLYCFFAPEIRDVSVSNAQSPWLVIPYVLVIVLALCGINVMTVLLSGIFAAIVLALVFGTSLIDICTIAGGGVYSVSSLIIITLLAAGMLGIIKENGGIDYILQVMGRNLRGARSAQLTIVGLVGIVNLCTANNTVAIITVGSLAKKIAKQFEIMPRKAASLLDTGSCVVQALIPYGAQTLMATSLAGISPAAPWPYLFYPQILIVSLLVSILIIRRPR